MAQGTETVQAYVAAASNAQRRLWFIERLDPGRATYNIPAAVRLSGALDVGLIERVITAIVARHDALRTTFGVENGLPVQIVRDASAVSLPVRSIEPAMLEASVTAEARAPFDLAAGPLFRAVLFRMAPHDHVLLLTLHHIVADGWSMGVLVKEFTELYRAYSSGTAPRLAELPMQFADFVEWQNELLSGPAYESQLKGWRRHLAGAPLVLELATDSVRPPEQSHRGATLVRPLPEGLTDRLTSLARSGNATPFMLLLAVFETLMSRCARQQEFLIGTPVAGRSHTDTEGLIGFFVNTLVLRADLQGDPTFLELLDRVRQECLGAFAHQDVPFDRLVDALQPERDRSRSPLFQTYFAFQPALAGDLTLPGLTASVIEVDMATAKVDLTLGFEETPSGLTARWEYSSDLFTVETVQRWASMFATLCVSVVDNPRRHISDLPLLMPAERAELLAAGGTTAAPCELLDTLHGWFGRAVGQFPDRTAITDGETAVSYRELDSRSNRLARHLRQLGVGPETRVGISLARNRDLLVAILGVLKAGGAYVPIDPAYPRDRIQFILADSGVAAVITDGGIAGLAEAPVIDISKSNTEYAAALPELVSPDNAAYVIYTSGSTGQPKGCVVTHGNVTRLMLSTDAWFAFGPDDVWTLFHSFAFDFSVWEIWGALLYGGRLVVVPYEVSRSPEAFYRLLETERVTVLNQTPSAFRQLSAVDSESGAVLRLRYVVFGGEALELATLAPWMDRHGDAMPQLINMYGITETTVHVTYRRLRREDVDAGRGSLIGVPIPDLSLHVVDERLEPAPVGVPGEIVVGGAGLARGYLGRPDLTAQRFVANPFGPGRLYRSGDQARRLADGGLEYLGRMDQQVKIRGFRIELGEIERALSRVPGVHEVVVVAKQDSSGGKRLTAYLTSRPEGPRPTAAAAREFCRAWLPDYMIPAAFVFLPALPLTDHGKVDRRALPEPDLEQAATAEYAAPGTPAEMALAEIWSRVLGVPRVGLGDNFFALGGDSILTIQVVTQARKAGLRLAPKDLFERQTLQDLASAAEPDKQSAPVSDPAPLAPAIEREVYPATPMQAGMLFQSLLEPERDIYFEQVSGDVRGPLVTAAFRSAWQGLMDRHPTLRTSFLWREEGEPLQIVNREVQLAWQEHDWSHLSSAEQAEAWNRLLAEDRRRGFALREAPLWRVTLVRLQADRHRWLWSHFHGLLDGWCLPLVFEDVLADYEFLAHGTGSRPPAGLPYRPYVEWLRAQDRAAAERYWRESLSGFEAGGSLLLPAARSGEKATNEDDAFELRLGCEESAAVREWARRHRLTLNTVFQGAWALLLARLGMGNDVVFGVTVAGRPAELPGVERTLGLFINTLPLRVAIDNAAESVAWLEALQQSQARMRQFESSSLVDVQNWSGALRGQALFETILVFENYPGDELLRSLPSSLRLENLHTAERTNYLLTAAVLPGEQIALRLHFDPRRLEREPVERMLLGWRHLALELSGAPRRVGDISLTSPEELRNLHSWSAAPAFFGEESAVHRLVAAQAARHPDAAALLAPGREVSYREMMTRASALAAELQRRGVGLETPVAVCMEKSPEMVVAWLAILITGGTFVPLDPRFATIRIATVVSDAVPLLILLHQPTAWAASLTSLPVVWVEEGPKPAGESVCTTQTVAVAPIAEQAVSPAPAEAPCAGPTFPEVSAQNLAYIIHTSGSTGQPKGVMLSHGGLSNLALAQAAICQLGPGSRGLQFASVSFDAAVSEVFMALVSGAAIWLEPRDQVPDPAAFGVLMETAKIDHATLPPALLQALPPNNFRGLGTLLIAGEAASEELFRRWAQDGRRVFNAYGPTEITVCATMEQVVEDLAPVTLGRPLANLRVFIVDRQMNLVPPGVAGEIVVGGAGVARGYLNHPGLTAGSFVPDPFSNQAGARLYCTGDLGRWTSNGRIEFLGRVDRQVKVRGYRVEPAEIEAALKSSSEVSDAVAVARNDSSGMHLAAFALARPAVTSSELFAYLRGRLPDYAMPHSVTVLESWPLTPAGKIDRRALAGIEPEAASEPREFSNETERQIAEIWSSVLRLNAIGPDDNYFELGGDSILSLQIIARANQAGLNLTPRQIFQNPTVRRLAQVADRRLCADAKAIEEKGFIPLTPIQHWFFGQEQPEPHHWNQSLMLELRDPAVAPLIGPALAVVVNHHGSFRLRFRRQDDGSWQQYYAERTDAPAAIQTYPETEMRAVMSSLQASLDLARGPLWRAAIFERGPAHPPLLFLAVHHLVVDGVSWRILAEDLAAACRQIALSPPTATLGHWARALETAAASTARAAEAAYWRDLSATPGDLPVDFFPADSFPERPVNDAASADLVSAELDEQTTSQMLREANAAYRLNTNELLLAVLARTLSGWSGQSAHLINVEGHGREELEEAVDITRTVGWFTTIFPFRLESAPSDAELLTSVKDRFRAVPGKGLGFGLLRYLSPDPEVRRQLAAVPRPRLSFNYLGQTDQTLGPDAPFALSQIPVESGHSPRAKRVHSIDINAMVTGGRLRVDWIYCRRLHRRSTIEALCAEFFVHLRHLIAHCLNPDAGAYTPSDFQLAGLSAQELDAVLEDLGNPV